MNVNNQDEYFHAILKADQDGLIYFDPLPYRATPYPLADLIFDDVYEHAVEDKVWLIEQGPNGAFHVMYKNDVTNGRFVYQLVKSKPTKQERIKEKTDKGYVQTKPMRFYPNTRKLTTI